MATRDPASLTNGPAWAAVLAAAVGCAAFGLLADLAEAVPAASRALVFYAPSGNLSGKAVLAVAVWGVAWAVLHLRWKGRAVRSPMAVGTATSGLILLGLIATFPPVLAWFARGR